MEKAIKIGDKTYLVASDDYYLDAMGSDFEPHMVELFHALIVPNDVVADIGANIGLTAILFTSLACQVHAFEPNPSTFRMLSRNLKQAGVENIKAVNLGLGDRADSLTISFASNNRSGGFVSDKIRPEQGHVTEEIKIDTIDHYLANNESTPNFSISMLKDSSKMLLKGEGITFLRNL